VARDFWFRLLIDKVVELRPSSLELRGHRASKIELGRFVSLTAHHHATNPGDTCKDGFLGRDQGQVQRHYRVSPQRVCAARSTGATWLDGLVIGVTSADTMSSESRRLAITFAGSGIPCRERQY
jgi:hypothetical protein